MLTFNNVSFEFGGRFLYHEASIDIQPGHRIGLIGRNGTGKSTMLRLMAGEYQPTSGQIIRANNLKIGFLNQDLLGFESSQTVFQVALSAFDAQLKLQHEIAELLQRMEKDFHEDLVDELGEKQLAFEQQGGYEMEAQASTILAGLGFAEEDQHRPFDTFSGGWRMRAILARMLLTQPDLLLLDEPTNHLDLPSIEWLEDYLKRSPAAYILVTHDRHFLGKMVEQVVEIENSKLHYYNGDYAYYLREKPLRREIQQAAYENQQKFIADNQRFIERFKAKASKATQAQSRVKMLEKLDRIEAPESDEAVVSFAFRLSQKPGADILSLEHVHKQYEGGKAILNDANAVIRRGDKIGLIGANGVGKSTVLRIIAGTEPTQHGQRKLGYNVQTTFFAQHQLEALTLTNSILEEMAQYSYDMGETYVRSILGGFLFTGDDVFKKIKMLSGGERSRVALAKTLLSAANFMLLDEPTNHLDMQSIQILGQALAQYEGSYVIVSHDRYFLRQTTNKIWYIEDQQVKEYPGSYTEYEAWRAERAAAEQATKTSNKKQAAQATALPQADGKALRAKQNQFKKLEETIAALEKQIQQIDDLICLPENAENYTRMQSLEKERMTLQHQLESQLADWELLGTEIDAMQA